MSLSEMDRHRFWDDISFTSQVVHCLDAEKNSNAVWHWSGLDDELGTKTIGFLTAPA